MNDTIKNLKHAPTTTAAFVGDLVSPTMSTAAGLERLDVEKAFRDVGIDVDFNPGLRGLFGRAFYDARQKQYVGAIHEALSWERESARGDALLLRWSIGKGRMKNTRTAMRLTLRPHPSDQPIPHGFDPLCIEHGDFWSAMNRTEQTHAFEALEQFRARFHWHRVYVATGEVRNALEAKLFAANGVKISSSLYFVPASGHDVARALETAVAESKSGDVAVFPQFDNAIGTQRTGRMVANALLDEIRDVRAQLRNFIERDSKVRQSTIDARLTKLREIRERAQSCVAVLGAEVRAIEEFAQAATASVLADLESDDGDIAAE